MSALNNAQTLPAMNLQSPVARAAVAKDHPLSSAQGESSKDKFSRLLERSRDDAASARDVGATSPRQGNGPAGGTRTARAAEKGVEPRSRGAAETTDADGMDTSAGTTCAAEATGSCAASGKRGADERQTPADRPVDDEATTAISDVGRPLIEEAAPGAQASAAVSDLMVMLSAGVLPPMIPVAPPATGAVDANTVDSGSANVAGVASSPLALLSKAGGSLDLTGLAGVDTTAPAQGTEGALNLKDGSIFGVVPPVASMADPAAAPVDSALTLDLGKPAAAMPEAALAQLAALTGRTGQPDEARKIPSALEALPLGSSAALAHPGVGPLVRASDSPAIPTATVSTAVTDSGFQEALATQVSVFARGGMSKAELHLNPAEMGPVSVQIMMHGDQARVDFGADRAQTRQAIEAGWAALAAALQDAGFTLSGGGVSEQASRQAAEQQASAQPSRANRSTTAETADPAVTSSIVAARPRAGAALDLYA